MAAQEAITRLAAAMSGSSGPVRAGSVARRVPAGVFPHIHPHRLRASGEGVAARPPLGGVADGISELGRGQDGDAVDELGLAGDVVIERRGLDPEPFGEQNPILS